MEGDNKSRWNWALGMSGIAMAISLIAICASAEAEHMKDYDYLGMIIGALALLVAVLIGWNIYSLIDLKETKREIDKTIKDRVNIAKEEALWEIYRTAFEMHARNPTFSGNYSIEPFIRYGLMYVSSSMILNFNDSIVAALDVFESLLENVNRFDIKEKEKKRIKSILNEIEELNIIRKREEAKAIIELIRGKV